MVISDPIMFQMLSQKYALKLEINGIRHSRGSVYHHIKKLYGLKGNKISVYKQFCDLIREKYGDPDAKETQIDSRTGNKSRGSGIGTEASQELRQTSEENS